VIGVVVAAGAVSLYRDPVRGRQPALAALAFAIFGFIIGLTFTIGGGAAVDLAYHAVMLPVLVVTLLALIGSDTVARRHGSESRTAPR
jgi:peptidoglycan/LPS O-acetylase OafA/YrhL